MTWKQTSTMTEKLKFLADYNEKLYSFTELCNKYGISRKTGYKLVNRYEAEGIDGLRERSRAHKSHPYTTSNEIKDVIMKTKSKFPLWGPKKIRSWLLTNRPDIIVPVSSTIGEILYSHGLVKPRKKRSKVAPYTQPFKECLNSNAVWSADFKGQFKLGNKKLCYPLTITDNYSRYLLGCKGLYNPTYINTKLYFETIFKEYGLPHAIKTDNGAPFSSTSIAGLSQLSIWWVKLGITPERIKAGHPEQNGRHERMHRTLKEHTVITPGHDLKSQQALFDDFIYEYNNERPHEALSDQPPVKIYRPSLREMPNKLPALEYNDNCIIRKVRMNGEIKWHGKQYYLAQLLYGEPVGLEEIDDDIWQIYFSNIKLGILNLRKHKIIRAV